jgi:hypothetical protein
MCCGVRVGQERGIEPEWLIPGECSPGQIVGVHFVWSPHVGTGNDWYEIPPEPMASIYGEFVPIARVFNGGLPDNLMSNCAAIVKGVVGLFQEDEEYITVVVRDQEYFIPRGLPHILCEPPEDVEDDEEEKRG